MAQDFTDYYMNYMQLLASIVDANKLFIEAGRGTGKTEGVTGPRTIRVAQSMPRETSAFVHKTYMALMNNIIPNLLAYYRSPKLDNKETLLREGIDYVVGCKDLPKHFVVPRYPLNQPEHTIVFANGHNIRLAASDQPEAIAGSNIVHGFFEEMKHNKGDKIRSRIIPAFRVGRLSAGANETVKSPYYGGITGVSDSARLQLGEDNWFNDYESKVDKQLIEDIITVSLHVEKARCDYYLGKDKEKAQKIIDKYTPLLNQMRKASIFYIRVSSLVNRDVLGVEYFRTQADTLPMSELLSSIFSIRDRSIEDMFFPLLSEDKHFYEDSYIYKNIMSINLRDQFSLDAGYLKYYNPSDKILLGYDPGSFASMVAAQEYPAEKQLRILKEFYVYAPQDIPDLARIFAQFFSVKKNKSVDLYYDRAGNKKESRYENASAAKELKAEIEKYGFRVRLMNLGQQTIYHWQHYKLWQRLLSNAEREVPRILIDANECPYLKSALFSCKKINGSSPIELDKSPERKLPLNMQAGLSPQIPSGLMYLVYGLYAKYLPGAEDDDDYMYLPNLSM